MKWLFPSPGPDGHCCIKTEPGCTPHWPSSKKAGLKVNAGPRARFLDLWEHRSSETCLWPPSVLSQLFWLQLQGRVFVCVHSSVGVHVCTRLNIGVGGCGDYSWLSAWLLQELTKSQAAGHACENFFHNGVIRSGKIRFKSGSLRWEDPPFIWAASSAGGLERTRKKEARSLCLLAFALTPKSTPSLALELLRTLAHTKDQLRHPASQNEKLLDSSTFVCRQTLLDYLDHSL